MKVIKVSARKIKTGWRLINCVGCERLIESDAIKVSSMLENLDYETVYFCPGCYKNWKKPKTLMEKVLKEGK